MQKLILFKFTESIDSHTQVPLVYKYFFSVASSHGYRVTTTYNSEYEYDVLIFFKIEDSVKLIQSLIKRNPSIRLYHLRFEENCISPFNNIKYTNNQNYFSLSWRYFDDKLASANAIAHHIPLIAQTSIRQLPSDQAPTILRQKLICMILSNKHKPLRDLLTGSKYLYRKELAIALSNSGNIDIYGPNWEFLPSSCGYIEDLHDTLQKYDFNLIVANSDELYNVCEKIFNSFCSGTIPIYIGASKINEFIPFYLYLQFDFCTPAHVIINAVSSYNAESILYWRKSIQKYLISGYCLPFTDQDFANSLISSIENSSTLSNPSSSNMPVTYFSLFVSILTSRKLTIGLKVLGVLQLIKKLI